MDREVRAFKPAEIRADNEGIRVSGYAAVFGEETNIGGMFREVIAPGAFTDAIGRDDVVFLINHDGLPLARTRSGTLILTQDDVGLRVETMLDGDDPDVKSIVGKMKRGDLDKMSFAFMIDGKSGQRWDETGDIPLRTVIKASLFDVSIVTQPAYDGTSIGLRSLEAFRKDQKTTNFNAAAMRHRMKMNLRFRGAENG